MNGTKLEPTGIYIHLYIYIHLHIGTKKPTGIYTYIDTSAQINLQVHIHTSTHRYKKTVLEEEVANNEAEGQENKKQEKHMAQRSAVSQAVHHES
jgi:hypothetical protein